MAPENAGGFAAAFGRTDYISTLHSKPLHESVLRNILHMVAIHGDKMTTNILSQVWPTGVDPEARDFLGKTAREHLEE